MTFGLLVGSRNYMRLFWVSWKVCFTRVWLDPQCCQILYHHGHIDDCFEIHFLHRILWSAVIKLLKMFRAGHDCTSTSSARCPLKFLQADITIWVLRKVRKHTVLTRTRCHFCLRLHWKFMRWLGSVSTSLLWVSPRLSWSTFVNQFLSKFAANQAIHAIFLFVLLRAPHFDFLFSVSVDSCSGFLRNSSLALPLLSSTGFSVYLLTSNTKSCDEDDGEVREDKNSLINREPQMAHCWTFCIKFSCSFFVMWFLTAGPAVRTPMILTELPERKNCGSFIKKHNFDEQVQLFDKKRRSFSGLHLAVWSSSPSSDSSMYSWSPTQQSSGLSYWLYAYSLLNQLQTLFPLALLLTQPGVHIPLRESRM